MLCLYGCKKEAKYQFKNGKWCCSNSMNKCPEKRRLDSLKKKGKCPKWKNGHPKPWLGKLSPLKGKNYEEIFGKERSIEVKKKLSKSISSLHLTGMAKTEEKEKERRRKIKEKALISNNGGYRQGSGIGKKGWYKGFWCDSSWELAFVIYHLDNKIQFKRNSKKFDYFWNGKVYKYVPDYKYPDDTYIEVKSFLCEQTNEKIKQFPGKLVVLMKEEMKNIFSYVIDTYGKDFIKLYEEG